MTTLHALRLTARFAVPLGIAATAVTLAAAPALAASSVTVTGDDGGQVDHQTTLSVVAHYDNSRNPSRQPVKLVVSDPSGVDHTLWSTTAGALQSGTSPAQAFDTSCAPWTSPCADAVNGSYSFYVTVGSTQSSPTTVHLNVPPAAVAGFRGDANGTVATFDWSGNSEPDLVDYDVRNSAGDDVTRGGLDPSSVCDGSGCSVSIQFGSGVSGTQQQFSIVARRRSANGGLVESTPSSTDVSFPSAASPAPSGGAGGGGSGSAGGGRSGGGGAAGGGAQGGAGHHGGTAPGRVTGKHPAADLRASLPTLTAGSAPDLPSVVTEVKPLPMGTYKPLVYPDQVKRDVVHKPRPGVAAAVVGDLRDAVDSTALWRALAGAAVLMLVAAHLRAWVERADAVE
ncbi:MAG TPA: hypothetical protein VFJ98_01380 [Mycobacteriales bacterium]|nr:hypothetical protein [Mycobacteriales bacterium]